MKNIVILGSTGSIGRQTLDVVRANRDKFNILALCACRNIDRLNQQIIEFQPEYVGICETTEADGLKIANAELICGNRAASELASLTKADIVVNGISGFAGLEPLFSALNAGKTVATANKESIVCAHGLVDDAIRIHGGMLIPVDSEQCAIFQCLDGHNKKEVKRLILTASGGPFRDYTAEQLRMVTPEQAMHHPTWRMGKKITIDSATLFNKGLEIIEASYLFAVPAERVDVVVHPQSVIHSMVEYADNSVLAQLSMPDMRLDIQYALTYPKRTQSEFGMLDLVKVGKLEFYEPDTATFRSLPLAYEALKEGAVLPITYNAANEVAVERFIKGDIGFADITDCVEYAMGRIEKNTVTCLENIIETDRQARRLAGEAVK